MDWGWVNIKFKMGDVQFLDFQNYPAVDGSTTMGLMRY